MCAYACLGERDTVYPICNKLEIHDKHRWNQNLCTMNQNRISNIALTYALTSKRSLYREIYEVMAATQVSIED